MATTLGTTDYRQGAVERLEEARLLLENRALAGSVYLAGRAVESMLRALIWRYDTDIRMGRSSLDTGHDLRELLARVRNLGAIRSFEINSELSAMLQDIARLWSNNMRFWSSQKLVRHWREIGQITKRRSAKQVVSEYYQWCSAFSRRCEELCEL